MGEDRNMISDEAVEAAARGIASANLRWKPYAELDEETKNHFKRDAKAALEATAPRMSLRIDWLLFVWCVIGAACAFAVTADSVPQWIAGFPAGLLTLIAFRALWSRKTNPHRSQA